MRDAVTGTGDDFVRYRALVLLTGFEEPGTGALMKTLVANSGPNSSSRYGIGLFAAVTWLEC